MADHLINNSVDKKDAAAYDHSVPGVDGWLHNRHSKCQLQKILLGLIKRYAPDCLRVSKLDLKDTDNKTTASSCIVSLPDLGLTYTSNTRNKSGDDL